MGQQGLYSENLLQNTQTRELQYSAASEPRRSYIGYGQFPGGMVVIYWWNCNPCKGYKILKQIFNVLIMGRGVCVCVLECVCESRCLSRVEAL